MGDSSSDEEISGCNSIQTSNEGATSFELSDLLEGLIVSQSKNKRDDEKADDTCTISVPTSNLIEKREYVKTVSRQDDFVRSCLKAISTTVDLELMTKGYYITDLHEYSREYQNVHSKFLHSNPYKCSERFEIEKIQKVINPFLMINYHLKESEYNKKHRRVEEMLLFHGTSIHAVTSICKENFNWRLTGHSTGHKFGQGVSFTPDSYYASHYGCQVMFLADVLVSETCLGDDETLIPQGGIDTTTNDKGTVYVKYDDDTFYPKYIIHYV